MDVPIRGDVQEQCKQMLFKISIGMRLIYYQCKLSRLGKGPQTESETFELAATSMPIPNVKGSKGQSQIECDKEDFDLGYAPLINMDVPDLFKISFTEPRMFFGNAQQRAPPDKPDTVVTFSGLIAKGSDGAKKYAPRELIKYNIQYQAKDEGDFKGGIYTYNVSLHIYRD